MIKEKNIAVNVILSIVTCGIYGIIWFINLTDDAAYLNDDRDFQGEKHSCLVLSLVESIPFIGIIKWEKNCTMEKQNKDYVQQITQYYI